ncbi:uncharacterized protein [Amphiura filiformis]|uniref:uncharacterized protein n=1 Tax=Amphiura filiformis TaxID=82378 RepID=UPI003B216994
MDDKGILSKILIEIRRGLAEENLPLDEVLDDLQLEDIIDDSERDVIDETQEKDQLKKLFGFLKKKPDLALAYKAFRTQLMKHASDCYDKKVKPIEDKHNYNKGSSGETNQEADEGVKPSIQVVHPQQRVQDESLDSSTQQPKVEPAESTHQSAQEGEQPTPPASTEPAQSGKNLPTDVEPGTAQSKKEDKKDVSEKQDVIHVTAESKKEDGKDGTGKPGHVMISYNWGVKEEGFPCQQRMIKLRDELIADNYRVWMDVVDMDGNMDDRMAEAVENAYVILMCVSEKYQASHNCKKEAQYAFFLKRPIVILKYDRHTATGWLGLQINNLLYYDVQTEEAMMGNLPKIKEQLDKGKPPTRQTDHDPESNEGLIEKIAIELRKRYENTICKKQMYPWQTGECIDFDTVYIPVTIDRIVESGLKPIRESLKSYQDLFELEEDKKHTRFLLVGSPGQGKSSFCAKLAHDWCCGKTMEDIRLLFILELASVNRKVSIEEEIRKKLLKNMQISDSEIRKVIQSLDKSIFFIFDGLDEAPKDIFLRDDDIGVVEIMKNDVLTECRLLVTTRPWREDEILKKVPGYKRLELKKMTRKDVKEYIEKLFGLNEETKSLGKSLLEYIDSNKLTIDTHTPLVVLLLSWYWTQTKGKDGIPERIADLYDRMTNIMHEKSSTGLSKIIKDQD